MRARSWRALVPRPARALLLLLALCFCICFKLFLALVAPVLLLALLPPLLGGTLGTMAALGAALLSVRPASIVSALKAPPWVPTPSADLHELLELGGARPGHTLLELGSGDGRNLVAAASAGLRAVGLEVSPLLCGMSWLRAALSGHGSRVTVQRADVLADPLPADVDLVFAYLSRELMASLKTRLACAYGRPRRGAPRVLLLSRDFAVPGWTPRTRLERGRTTLYVYAVPRAPRGSPACAPVGG